jgi:PAS domain S-box-containing protein
MPVAQSRRIRIALWTSLLVLIIPLGLALSDVAGGGARAWLRLISLAIVGTALLILLSRQRHIETLIGEQARVETALRESEAKYSGILAIAADAIISVDSTHRIQHFNSGAEKTFGYTAADATGRHLSLLLPHRYREMHERHMEMFARSAESARRMGERQAIFGLRADGTEFPAEASISKLVQPDGILFTVVLRDVTEHRRAEDNERFMAEATRSLASSLDVETALLAAIELAVPKLADAAFIDLIESDTVIRRVVGAREDSPSAAALRQLASHPITFDSPSPVVDMIRRRRAEVIDRIDDDWFEMNEDAAAIPAWRALAPRALAILPLIVGDRALGAMTLVVTDSARGFRPDQIAVATKFASAAATTIENARLYALAQRANQAREAVLSVVSHDLRNPLSAITMCATTLAENPPATEAGRQALVSTIRESAAVTNRLIQDLVDVTSLERGRMSLRLQPTDVTQLVLQARHMFDVEAEQHGIALDYKAPTDLPLAVADHERIVQVLGNLLRNAIKFTPSGGRITLEVRRRDDQLEFSVRDTGPGIAPENQARVFERYWQRADGARARGTGLGLSIAKGIVEMHGGQIWLESAPGAGATFYFTLPMAKNVG